MVVAEWEVTDWEVMEWHHILSAVVDLAVLVQTAISHFFITISITAADFSVIAMISSSGTVSSLVLTSRHLDSLAGGTLITTRIRIPMPTMATRLPTSDEPSSYGGDPASYGTQYWSNLAISVQTKLAQQSYYHGSIDGVLGPASQLAIKEYQAAHRIRVTGRIDPKLLKSLGISYKA